MNTPLVRVLTLSCEKSTDCHALKQSLVELSLVTSILLVDLIK